MLEKIKNKLINNINQAKKKGELTPNKIYHITHKAVIESEEYLKGSLEDIKDLTKEVIMVVVNILEQMGDANKKNISAIVHGTIDAIKESEAKYVDKAQREVMQAKKKLQEERANLSESVTLAFLGAKEATECCGDTVKEDIESALKDTKLNSAELLGLSKQTVKEAIRLAIETGKDIESNVENTTRKAVYKAMNEADFSARRTRKITETILSAAVEAAQESDQYIKEIVNSATEGIRKGLTDSVECTQNKLKDMSVTVEALALDALEQTIMDLESVSELFVEVLRKVADKSDHIAKNILHDAAEDAQKVGNVLQEKAHTASQVATKKLTDLGYEAVKQTGISAHKKIEETKELAERMLAIAKGVTTGGWVGAKTAFYKNRSHDK